MPIDPPIPVAAPGPRPGGRVVRPSRARALWRLDEPGEVTGAPGRPPSALRDLGTVVLMFLLWRGLLFGVDFAGRTLSAPVVQENHYPESRFWDGYIRHDSLHFRYIIREGYRVETEGKWKGMSTNAAFFPLYPYAVKALARLKLPGLGRPFGGWAAGLLISNVSLLLALFYILRIARLGLDEAGARRSLVYLLVFPTSFYFSSFYSEGLFLLTTSASFYHYLGGRRFRCGVWGLLAAMTRSPGITLLAAFLLGHLWERRLKVTRSDLSLLWLGLIPCGLAAVMGILYLKLGDPLAFSKAHAAWGRSFMPPHETIWRALCAIDWTLPTGTPSIVVLLDLVSSLAFLALPLYLPGRFPRALSIYALLLILMPLSTGQIMSMMRCEVVAFPSFFALARFGEDRGVDRLIVFGSALFLGLFKLAFANGFFFG